MDDAARGCAGGSVVGAREAVTRREPKRRGKQRADKRAEKEKGEEGEAEIYSGGGGGERRSARTTVVPAGAGRYRLQINAEQRKAAQADVGDVVSMEVRLDTASRSLPVPADLRAGLRDHPKAWKAFEALAPGQRRQLIQWFDSAKAPETRRKRLDRAIDVLLERALLSRRQRAVAEPR